MNLLRQLSIASLVISLLVQTQRCLAQEVDKQSMEIVPAGTVVVDEQAMSWNRVILLATPRLSSGEFNKLPEGVRSAVPKLTLSILATVRKERTLAGDEAFQLQEIGVAYSAQADDRMVTVTSESAPRLGAQLDFFSRRMLTENEKQLAKVQLLIRTTTLAIFDAPSIVLRDGQHKDFMTRHLVWIDGRTGKLAFAVWLLSGEHEGQFAVAGNSLRLVAPGTREDRKVHVDGRSFFMGFPSARAFALEDLPPGIDVPWTASARQLAGRSSYDQPTIQSLVGALNQMLSQR